MAKLKKGMLREGKKTWGPELIPLKLHTKRGKIWQQRAALRKDPKWWWDNQSVILHLRDLDGNTVMLSEEVLYRPWITPSWCRASWSDPDPYFGDPVRAWIVTHPKRGKFLITHEDLVNGTRTPKSNLNKDLIRLENSVKECKLEIHHKSRTQARLKREIDGLTNQLTAVETKINGWKQRIEKDQARIEEIQEQIKERDSKK